MIRKDKNWKKLNREAQDARLDLARSLKKKTGIHGQFIKCHKKSVKNLKTLSKKKIFSVLRLGPVPRILRPT